MNARLLFATSLALCLSMSSLHAQSEPGQVQKTVLISEGLGGFTGALATLEYFGADIAELGDLDGDGISEIAVGAERSDVGGTDTGRVWLLFMNSGGQVKSWTKIDNESPELPFALEVGDFFGSAVEAAGDLDGDGVPDLWVGARGDDEGEPYMPTSGPGAIYSVMLLPTGQLKSIQKISGSMPGLTLDPEGSFGASIAVIGDVFGDGSDDLAVGAPYDDGGGSNTGAVYLINLKAGGVVSSAQRTGPGSATLDPNVSGSAWFGDSVEGLGDVDGNGSPDYAVGAASDSAGSPNSGSGSIFIYFTDSNGPTHFREINRMHPGFTTDVPGTGARFGCALAALGDIDGDGHGDLAVGARGDGQNLRGAVWILRLSDDPNDLLSAVTLVDDDHGFLDVSLGAYDSLGSGLAALEDRDGNGIKDLVVGAIGYDVAGQSKGAIMPLSLRGPTIRDLGKGLVGDFEPQLEAIGTLLPGKLYAVQLSNADAFKPAYLVLGFSELNAPFRGGTMVPALDQVILLPGTDLNGELDINASWPIGIPEGFDIYIQFWMSDPGAPVGVNASNALALVAAE